MDDGSCAARISPRYLFVFIFLLPCLFSPFLYLLLFSLFLFSNWPASVVRMRSDRYYVQYRRGTW